MKLLIMQFPPTSSVCVPPLMSETKFRTHAEPKVLYIIIFMFIDSKREGKRFCTEW
jgi:hypothetical protein